MHNIKELRNNLESFQKKIKSRNIELDLKKIIDTDKKNRELIQKKELLESEKKKFQNQKIKAFLNNQKKFQKI